VVTGENMRSQALVCATGRTVIYTGKYTNRLHNSCTAKFAAFRSKRINYF
jgi:hypothetical protein